MIKAGVKNDGPKPEGMEKMIEIYNLTKITSISLSHENSWKVNHS